MSETKYCPNCMEPVKEGAKFCNKCGEKLIPESAQMTDQFNLTSNNEWDITDDMIVRQNEEIITRKMENFDYEKNADGTYIIKHFKEKYASYANIPDCVNVIAEHAFEETKLSEITLPDTLIFIGEGAFRNCKYLEKINIPASVMTIEDEAFAGCEKLNVTIPSTVRNVGKNVIAGTIPDRAAKEKAERKAREAEERKAREESARKAREEAERKAREEAERKAREETARKEREEAERKAAAAQREREEVERRVKAESELRAQAEAARKEAARKEREEAERKVKEAAELKAREEAARKEREDAARRAREEAEKKLHEAAELERINRQTAALVQRAEESRKAKEAAEQRIRADQQRKEDEAKARVRAEASWKRTRKWLIITYIIFLLLCMPGSIASASLIRGMDIASFISVAIVAAGPSLLILLYSIVAGIISKRKRYGNPAPSFAKWHLVLTTVFFVITCITDTLIALSGDLTDIGGKIKALFFLAIMKVIPWVLQRYSHVAYVSISKDGQ